MNFKLLELLKSSNYSNEEILQLINSAYFYYYKQSITQSQELRKDENKQMIFSNLVRFFRSINTNNKIEEGLLLSNLKDIFKTQSYFLIESLNEKVNEIISIQTKRINYSDNKLSKDVCRYFIRQSNINLISNKDSLNIITAIKSYRNLSYRINVTVSNKDSNRVLRPEIILIFTLDEGEKVTMQIDIKIFQELRKVLAYHIKKIIDNEGVSFLKN
jgi:hypothetical protein